MKILVLGLLMSALVSVASMAGQDPPDQPFKIDVSVSAVIVDAIVQDRTNRVVTDLKESDFEILENGIVQGIDYFASTDAPYSILLLFDFSGSNATEAKFMSEALGVFSVRLRQTDRLALASFGTQFQLMMDWRDLGTRKLDIPEWEPQAGSNVFRAIERSIETFKNEKNRKAIIVMTDGRDSPMFNDVIGRKKIEPVETDEGFQKFLANVKTHAIPTYFIALNTDRNRDTNAHEIEYRYVSNAMGQAAADRYLVAVRSRMEHIADTTGGKILYPKTLSDVVPLFDTIARDLGYSYSIGYIPKDNTPDGKARKIQIRLRNKNGLKVTQSRDSYTP
jgi:VWFA-related protein